MTVHSATGMVKSKVTDSDILMIWNRLTTKRRHIRSFTGKFRVGQHVRIRKEKVKFAKESEQNYSTVIFHFSKVINRTPQPVYELQDLNKSSIDGQSYAD
jgi:hypothetical protein